MPSMGRLVRFDERSREYPLRAILRPVQIAEPRGYTWRVGTHLDQGDVGACTWFAIGHELLARPAVVKGITEEMCIENYYETQRNDPWEGGSWPGANPYYEGTSVLDAVKLAVRLGHYKEYRWCLSENDLALAVGFKGPVILGLNWWSDMMEADSKGFIHPTGEVLGGHAILCHGVSIRYGYYKLWNSWGSSYGQDGTARISRADMATLLADQGEACVPLQRKTDFIRLAYGK